MYNEALITVATLKEFSFVLITFLSHGLSGISRSYPSFLFSQLESTNFTISVSNEEKSWTVSLMYLFNPLGCLISIFLMDVLGRKICVQGIFLPSILGWLTIGFAKNVLMLYIGMMLHGISTGMSFCVSTYVSEISLPEHRGNFLMITEVIYGLGLLVSNILMYYFDWNIVGIIFAAFSFVGLLLTFTLPESPVWLLLQGEKENSISVLSSLRCKQPKQLKYELKEIEDACELLKNRNLSNTWKLVIESWKPFVIVSFIFLIGQNTGSSIMILYMLMILDKLHLPYESSKIAIVYSAVICISGFTTTFLINKVGRKTILAAAGIGMGLSMIGVALYQEFSDGITNPYSWIVPTMFYVYAFFCAVGVIPIGFMMSGEVFPHQVSGVMNAINGCTGYIYSAVIFKFYPSFLTEFGIKTTLWTFAGFSILIALYGIFVLPETKDKTVDEVHEIYFRKESRAVEIGTSLKSYFNNLQTVTVPDS